MERALIEMGIFLLGIFLGIGLGVSGTLIYFGIISYEQVVEALKTKRLTRE